MDSGKVGSFIAMLRKEKNMTQQELADKLNVTNKAVSKWETGEGYPEITIVTTLADALDITADELLRGGHLPQQAAPQHNDTPASLILNEKLAHDALLKFKNIRLLSVGAALIGLIGFFVITLATYNELVGFGVLLAFLLVSILLFVLPFNNLNAAAKSLSVYCPEDLAWSELTAAGAKALITSIFMWSFILLAALPYIVFDNGDAQSILAFPSYLTVAPLFLAIGGFVTNLICRRVKKKLNNLYHLNLSSEKWDLLSVLLIMGLLLAVIIFVLSLGYSQYWQPM